MSKFENAVKIHAQLTEGGLTAEAAFAMLGNWEAESALRANNAEDRLHDDTGMSDAEYTAAVDNGSYPNFGNDGYGYGYYQLTFPARKLNYLAFVKERGTSIGDGEAQTEFALHELKTEYGGLYSFLCTTNDLYRATERICKEFERPAVNNVGVRYANAIDWQTALSGGGEIAAPTTTEAPARQDFSLGFRYLSRGCKGEDVRAWQRLLLAAGFALDRYGADGDFGPSTLAATAQYQRSIKVDDDGIVGPQTLGYMLGVR